MVSLLINELKAAAILVFTLHGTLARYSSWLRPWHSTIIALCPTEPVALSLTLNWGVIPVVIPFDRLDPDKTLALAVQTLVTRNLIHHGQTVVIVGAISSEGRIVDALQMRVVE